LDQKTNAIIGADYRYDLDLKVRDYIFLKLYEVQIFPNACARGPRVLLCMFRATTPAETTSGATAGSGQREIKRLMD